MTQPRRHIDRPVARLARLLGAALLIFVLWSQHQESGTLSQQQRQQHIEQNALQGLVLRMEQEARDVATDYTFLLESCQRLQIVRVEDNISHYADYRVFRAALVLTARSSLHRVIAAAVEAKTWVPVTDCARAVNTAGVRYKPPRPVPFVMRLPPRSALALPRTDFAG